MDDLTFRPYQASDLDRCLQLFDENCPESFAPNERAEYAAFLASELTDYEVGIAGGTIIAAFGLEPHDDRDRSIRWIMVSQRERRAGTGTAMVERAIGKAKTLGAHTVHIAASHVSAPFFAKFGAREVMQTIDGWGPGMHRIDMEVAL